MGDLVGGVQAWCESLVIPKQYVMIVHPKMSFIHPLVFSNMYVLLSSAEQKMRSYVGSQITAVPIDYEH